MDVGAAVPDISIASHCRVAVVQILDAGLKMHQ